MSTVLVTGGAGYVGAVLVPKLLAAGHAVRVLDLYLFGESSLAGVRSHPRLAEYRGDIRDQALLRRAIQGSDAVIHLACISNDPSFELDPALGKSINYDAFGPMVKLAREEGVRRFIYASSSSVYGIKDDAEVTEDLPLQPLTDYSKYKALCEDILHAERREGFTVITLRPATVCGYSPRLRLDLAVNILTSHAFHTRTIRVFGGGQKRPNIHIDDVAELYVQALGWPAHKVNGQVFNAGYQNHTLSELAGIVKNCVGSDVQVETQPSSDLRSYHISSEKIRRTLGFVPRRGVENAVQDLCLAFSDGLVPGALDDPAYYNIKRMQQAHLS